MKKKLKLLITLSLLIISNLTVANEYENLKTYDNFKDVYIIRLDTFKESIFDRYIFIFNKEDNKLLITKLCKPELITNKIENDICNESRINI